MNRSVFDFVLIAAIYTVSAAAQTAPSEFNEPWSDPTRPLVLDVYHGNSINWDQLATETRVKGIIHKASEGLVKDRSYAARKTEALKRGYKWGSFHLGLADLRAGGRDGWAQADFYLDTAKPADDEVIALDLEDVHQSNPRYMKLPEIVAFIERVHERTGRYPMLYITHRVSKAIRGAYGKDSVFGKTPLWYARYCQDISCYFPDSIWPTYTLLQFASEVNCPTKPRSGVRKCAGDVCPLNRCPLTKPIAGTSPRMDMDVNVYNGDAQDLLSKWPFTFREEKP